MACWQCCQPSVEDPDVFDGRRFLRRQGGYPPAGDRRLLCQPCSGAANDDDDVGEANPDSQKEKFASAAGRWGAKKEDQWMKPSEPARNVVATGMKRFEIGKKAPRQPQWEQLRPNVICVLGGNPSHYTLNGTCCYLIGTGKRRILIDTGEAIYGHEEFMQSLQDCMLANGIEGLQEILLTHLHHDHYGGVPGLLERFGQDLPVGKLPNPNRFFTTMETVRSRGLLPCLENPDGTPRFNPKPQPGVAIEVPPEAVTVWPDDEAEAGLPLSWDQALRTKIELIRDYPFVKRAWLFCQRLQNDLNFHRLEHGDIIRTEGATLVAYHTPGHADDHCSFWLQEEKSLFSGDHVLGWGTTFIFDLYEYMNTLQFMLALQPLHLYPGHGPMIEDGVDLLERYIVHRKTREDQVEDVLLQHMEPLAMLDIAKVLYPDTATERLWMAQENVQKILRKFSRSGVALCFIRQEDGMLERYSFSEHGILVRRLPTGLVWLHRFHFRTEIKERIVAAAPAEGEAVLASRL